jgi:alpha-amylase
MNPELKVLLKNYKLSDDIAFRFSDKKWCEWPLSAEKYASWIDNNQSQDEIINLFMDYETFGEHQKEEMGIFRFLKSLPSEILKNREFRFMTPSMVADHYKPVSTINVPNPISWADEERNLTAWLGNDMQKEAFSYLYDLSDKVACCTDHKLLKDWQYLQTSDHFYYMCTKYFSDGDVHAYFNPYESPYDAFMNYMNVLNDFSFRLNESVKNKKRIFRTQRRREYIEA